MAGGRWSNSFRVQRSTAVTGDEELGAEPVRLIRLLEDIIHYVIALFLLGVAIYVLGHTIVDAFHHGTDFGTRVTAAINGVLFVIIVLEILRTVLSHFEQNEFQLKPFLIIGIISAVRHILTVNAQISLGHSTEHLSDYLLELGVNAAVVLALVVGLVLVRRSEQRPVAP
jgi:uncharacterized membrane protein (DUF373 family)